MKRTVFGLVLLGLGAFLLVVGLMATFWAPGVVKKTPLDVNQVTHLDGTINKLDSTTGELVENPVKVESISKTDSERSDDDTVVWASTACVMIDIDDAPDCADDSDPRLVSATKDVFATDRYTAEAVPDFKGLPAGSTPHEGLINKWPFDTEKKDYTYWNDTVGSAVPAIYKGTEKIAGVETYKYEITVKDAPIEIIEGVNGTYNDLTTIYVEPKTGAIQQQTDSMQQYLDDGSPVVDLNIKFTDEQIKKFADDSKTNVQMLDMITFWMPLVGFIAGGLCVLAGVALLVTGRRRRNDPGSNNDHKLAGASA